VKGLVPVAMLLIGRGRPRKHPSFDDVTSGKKAPLGRILRNFRLRMRTPFQGNPLRGHVTDVTSGSHGTCTTVLHFVLLL